MVPLILKLLQRPQEVLPTTIPTNIAVVFDRNVLRPSVVEPTTHGITHLQTTFLDLEGLAEGFF